MLEQCAAIRTFSAIEAVTGALQVFDLFARAASRRTESPMTRLPPYPVDLTNCDREPIHLLGAIQPIGFLVVLSADWLVSRVSANIGDFFGVDARRR